MPHRDSPARPLRPAAPRRDGCDFEAAAAPWTAGSASRGRAATDPPTRRPPRARSRARAARTASPQSGSPIRTRRSAAAARQGSRPTRDPARPPTPPRRARPSRGAPARLSRAGRPRSRPTAPRCTRPAQPPRSATARRTTPSQRHRPPANPFRSPSCRAPYSPSSMRCLAGTDDLRTYGESRTHVPSEITSTAPSTTLMAVWSSMAYAGPAMSAAHRSARSMVLYGMSSWPR